MPLAQLINRPCVLFIASGDVSTDELGNPTDDLDPVETVCELQQQSRDEQDDQGELSDTVWRAFFLAAEDMGAQPTGNKLVVDGDTYEFTGDPWAARNPRAKAESHIEVTVRRTATEDGS